MKIWLGIQTRNIEIAAVEGTPNVEYLVIRDLYVQR